VKRASITLLLALASCDGELSFGVLHGEDAGAAPDVVALPFACDLRGPAYALGDGDPTCSTPGFHHALCSCTDYVSGSSTRVDGSLALGGALSAGDVQVQGALIVAGASGAPLTGDLGVSESLWVRGPLQGAHAVDVGGDAHIGGAVRVSSLRVGGTFTLAEDAALEVASHPAVTRAAVAVPAPCRCDTPLDLNALVDVARVQNDDATIALDPQLGPRTFEQPRTLELPCGRYYVEQIYAARPIRLRILGRVSLFVRDRVVTEQAGSLTIELEPDAELDLFARLGMTAAGPVQIGDARRPGATRVYVGSAGSLFFSAPTTLAATLHAPSSELVTQARFELFGAALLRRVVAEQPLLLHHDDALQAGSCAR
jgi:hypothetical protein